MVRILVVDDEKDFIDVVTAILKRHGYETESALSGQDALMVVGKSKIDLILLDLMMPDMDGFEVCKAIQGNPKTSKIPIIVVTAKGDFESIEKAYTHSSVKNYIAKPFKKETLLKTVAGVLETKEVPVAKKKAPKAIKERVYKEIIENFPEGIALLDSKNTIIDANNAFETITGFSKDEVLGSKNLPDLLKPLDDKGNRLLVSEAFKACFCDDPTSTAKFNIIHKSGVKLRVVSTVFKTKSQITVIVLRNITKN